MKKIVILAGLLGTASAYPARLYVVENTTDHTIKIVMDQLLGKTETTVLPKQIKEFGPKDNTFSRFAIVKGVNLTLLKGLARPAPQDRKCFLFDYTQDRMKKNGPKKLIILPDPHDPQSVTIQLLDKITSIKHTMGPTVCQ